MHLLEPCVGTREGASEASVEVRVGRANEDRKCYGPGCRSFLLGRKAPPSSPLMVRRRRVPRCPRTQARTYVLHRDLGGLSITHPFGEGRQCVG